jgi:hypothetical protein
VGVPSVVFRFTVVLRFTQEGGGRLPVKMIRPDDFISDYVPDGALKPLVDPALQRLRPEILIL